MRGQPLHPGWRDYRFLLRVFFLIWLSYVPGMWLISQFILEWFAGVPQLSLLIALVWMVAFLVSGCLVGMFQCPRCREYYFIKNLYHNPFGRRCRHCGLRKWTNPDHEAKPADESCSQP